MEQVAAELEAYDQAVHRLLPQMTQTFTELAVLAHDAYEAVEQHVDLLIKLDWELGRLGMGRLSEDESKRLAERVIAAEKEVRRVFARAASKVRDPGP